MKKLLLSILMCWVAVSAALAQGRTIMGKVTGADDGQPLPGVSIKIQGVSGGTQTNNDGSYKINVPSDGGALIFTYVGYATQTVSIAGKTRLNVALVTDSKALSEVVVVGYGTQERRSLTGSVGKIQGSAIADLPAPSFDKELAGRVTGVMVTEGSGLLNDPPTIRIRGTNSLSNEGGPLYVVDGIPIVTGGQSSLMNTNALGDINPADIESIDVLKDGSATAIYGSRASSGVILITTKKGKAGRQTISYNMYAGFSAPSKRLSVLNADQFIKVANTELENAGIPDGAAPTLDPSGKPYNTDWQSLIFRHGFQENHSLAVSGGTENSSYYFSAGFTDLKSDIVDNSQRKYNVRANVEQKALNFLTIGFTSTISYVETNGLNTGVNALSSNVADALVSFPNVPAINPDGSYNLSANGPYLGEGKNAYTIDNGYPNIKYVLDHNINLNQNLDIIGTGYIDAKIITGLNIRSQIGINSLYGEDYQYWNPIDGDGYPNGYVFQQYVPTFNYDWANTITYNKSVGKSNFNVVAGAEFQKTRGRAFSASGTGLLDPFFATNNNIISSTLLTPSIGGGISENSIRSFFGRFNYSYNDTYLLTLTYRSDYISNLGPNSKPGNLPGASLGWRISNEDFFKDASSLKFINDLKIRASFARTGNSNIGDYPFTSTYSPALYGAEPGIAYSSLGNPLLTYERTDKYDVGLDLNMFKSRITVTADYFDNKDNNLIQEVATPASFGVPGNEIAENIGDMYNKGFELGINSVNIQSKDFSWTTGFNITFIKNKVTKLYNSSPLIGAYNITEVGQSFNSFYGYTSAGVNQANGNPLYRKSNGQLIQQDVSDGSYYNYDPANPTAETTANALTANDKSVLGNSMPTYFGGLNNTFTYKNFDLGIYLTFSGGNKVFNATRQNLLDNELFDNAGTDLLKAWNHVGQQTTVPKLYYASDSYVNNEGSATTRFLEDGKFLRAQELTLGYSLPKSFTDKIKLTKLRVYAQVQNAFILTPYKGVDPEVSNDGTGVDYGANPRPRTFVVGLNVGF